MAILFITHKYPPAVGGMEKQSFELIKGFTYSGQNYIISYNGNENIILFFLALKKRVHKMLRLHPEITLIHLNDGLLGTFFYLLGINKFGRKVAVTFHGLDVVFPLSLYQKNILPKLHIFDAFICVSHATKDACIKRGFSPNKIFVVSNGVSTSAETSEMNKETLNSILSNLGLNLDNDIILLSIGRPVRRKGFSWFAREVMPLLDDRFKYVHVGDSNGKEAFFLKWLPKKVMKLGDLFIGRPNDAAELIRVSKRNRNVILAGKVADNLKETLICTASVIIMPNIYDEGDMEGFGLVALEASVKGKIVLAAGIEGVIDAVHDRKNGYLISTGLPHVWADKISLFAVKNLLFDDEIKQYTLDHFSWDVMVAGYRQVFDTLINKSVNEDI
jgi:glycosyltransferase involved in cell wall biosynthesis